MIAEVRSWSVIWGFEFVDVDYDSSRSEAGSFLKHPWMVSGVEGSGKGDDMSGVHDVTRSSHACQQYLRPL